MFLLLRTDDKKILVTSSAILTRLMVKNNQQCLIKLFQKCPYLFKKPSWKLLTHCVLFYFQSVFSSQKFSSYLSLTSSYWLLTWSYSQPREASYCIPSRRDLNIIPKKTQPAIIFSAAFKQTCIISRLMPNQHFKGACLEQ